MIDREKAIEGLERCKEGGSCDGCQYDIQSSKCIFLLHADALALLKEQETERLDFISAVSKLTAENEMLKSKQQIARDGEPKEGKCKKCGICGNEGRAAKK